MSFELRPYQTESLEAIKKHRELGIKRQMLVLPTGAGKTVVFTSLNSSNCAEYPMLVLAHREELLEQTIDKFKIVNDTLSIGLEKGTSFADETHDIVVASVASLGRSDQKRLERYGKRHFKTIVVDEAHHAAASTYRRVLDYFEPDLLLGVTATPQRGDGVRLDDVFDVIVYEKSMIDLIEEGYLTRIKTYRYNSPIDISDVKVTGGDFAVGELSKKINTDARHAVVLEAIQKLNPQKPIAFCADVAHAKDLAAYLHAHGVSAGAVWGDMGDGRAKVLDLHRSGEIKVLTNCGIATEGYDDPGIDMVIMARPTKSRVLYAQCIGRGLRLFEGKEHCLVVDIFDNSKTKTPVTLPSLMGLPPDFATEGEDAVELLGEFKKLEEASASLAVEVHSLEDLKASWERIDIFTPPKHNEVLLEFSQLLWLEVGNHYVLNVGVKKARVTIEENAIGTWDVSTTRQTGEPGIKMVHPTKLEAFQYADGLVRNHFKDAAKLLEATAEWRADGPTEKQIKFLKRNKIPYEHLTKGEASQIISKIIEENPRKERPAWLERKIQAEKASKTRF